MRHLLLASILVGLSGCQALQRTGSVLETPARDWREIATVQDRDRLRHWRTAFVTALQEARAAGHASDILREGVLLQPDAAIAGSAPIPSGRYRCRTIKVGAKSAGMLNFVSYPFFTCRVRQEHDLQGFAKLGGSQRQVGVLFPSDGVRQVFLGTLALADESRAMQYGRDRDRDVAGYVERIGTNRWRLVMPYPRFESQLDVLELVPIPSGA